MGLFKIVPAILLVGTVYCSEQFTLVEKEVSLTPKELYRHVDPDIQKVLARNFVQNITSYPQTCAESNDRRSGVHMIHPQPGFGDPFQAYCDQDYDGGGWTVIQNRFDGSVMFYQDWETYEEGFGNLNGEFWIGLRKIHELTNSKEHELLILLEDWEGDNAYAKYSRFSIASPKAKYELLRLGNYSGNAGDSLRHHHNKMFSTFDNDNDNYKDSCSDLYRSAWWFHECFSSNLNGWYWEGEGVRLGVHWDSFRKTSLRRTRMMIRAISEL